MQMNQLESHDLPPLHRTPVAAHALLPRSSQPFGHRSGSRATSPGPRGWGGHGMAVIGLRHQLVAVTRTLYPTEPNVAMKMVHP